MGYAVLWYTFPRKWPAVDLAMLSDGKYATTGMEMMMQALYLGRTANIRCMITASCYNCLVNGEVG